MTDANNYMLTAASMWLRRGHRGTVAGVTLEQATAVIARGILAAEQLGTTMTFAVVDTGGHLVALSRMDGCAFIATEIATSKAYTAAAAKLPTGTLKQFVGDEPSFLASAAVATGGRFIAAVGGYPVVIDGDVVGGVGASGGTAEQDEAVAKAAADS